MYTKNVVKFPIEKCASAVFFIIMIPDIATTIYAKLDTNLVLGFVSDE